MNATALFAKTPPFKLFFLASIPGAISMLLYGLETSTVKLHSSIAFL